MRSATAFVVLLSLGIGCSHESSPADTASSASSGGGGTIDTSASDTASAGPSTSGPASASSASAIASSSGSGGGGGSGGAGCVDVDATTSLVVATATTADDYALTLPATSASHTRWSEAGNEALILEVSGSTRGFIGDLVMHQGADGYTYGMSLGALAAGETVSVKVSSLSAASATPSACVGPAVLDSAASLGTAGEGLAHAPIFQWPVAKRFDDLPIVLGWSKVRKRYEAVYTNENGGTVKQCGGGADGMQAELARWGRGCDIEGMFNYGGADPTWERCTATVPFSTITPHLEGAHPIVYYGDGHNRLFESRGGYGQACGTGGPEKADGDLTGWNVGNPGNQPANDADYVITLRPLPVSLDSIGYGGHGGRREALVDHFAPWLYRIIDEELTREGKIDGSHTFHLDQYLYADVHASDVGGAGDKVCSFPSASGGFVLRAEVAGTTIDGPQMTASYFGAANDVKRVAIPLGASYLASDFTAIVFDAYDDDGIYWLGLGDVFVPRPVGDNGATIDLVHTGETPINVYVDDDDSGCTGGINHDGPNGDAPCAGTAHTFDL